MSRSIRGLRKHQKKSKWRMHGGKIRRTIQQVASLAHDLLGIYSSIKQKNAVTSVLGVLSAWGAVENMLGRRGPTPDPDLETVLKEELGLIRVFGDAGSVVYYTAQKLGVHAKRVELDEPEETDGEDEGTVRITSEHVEVMTFGDQEVYFYVDGGQVEAYAESAEKVVTAVSTVMQRELGSNIGLYLENSDVSTSIRFRRVSIAPEVYLPTMDEDKYLKRVLEFQKMGLNRSSLLFGPPGGGKTTFAARVAEHLGGRLLVLNTQILDYMSNYSIPLETIIQLVDPVVILFDDLDRVDDVDHLLGDLERVNRCVGSGRQRLIVGAVNDLNRIPAALRRPGRFDEVVKFDPPDKAIRKKLLRAYGDHFGTRLADRYVDDLATLTEGMTPAYLREVALQAKVRPIAELKKQVKFMMEIANLACPDEDM